MWQTDQGRVKRKMQVCTCSSIYFGEQALSDVTLVQCSFANTALDTLGTVPRTAGSAALLAGGTFAVFAFAGAGIGAGATSEEGAVGVHFQQR